MDHPPPPLLRRPEALLLDFGGVVFQTRKRPDGRADVARHLHGVLARAGHDVAVGPLRDSLDAGLAALKDWKNAAGRRRTPAELDHRTIWTDFLASDLDARAREVLAGDAAGLLAAMSPLLSEHEVRPGVRDLLAVARDLGVRVGMVSNAHSGRSHRTLVRDAGLEEYFDVQVYSDEVGIRKPHPEMIGLAARALGTVPERCWYVGDTQDRDVVAGRRAGVGAVALTRHHHTDTPPYPVRDRADAVLDTPEGLVDLLRHSRPASGASSPEPVRRPPAARRGSDRLPGALLLDQGGVVVLSTPTPDARRSFAESVAERLGRVGYATPPTPSTPSSARGASATAPGRPHVRTRGRSPRSPRGSSGATWSGGTCPSPPAPCSWPSRPSSPWSTRGPRATRSRAAASARSWSSAPTARSRSRSSPTPCAAGRRVRSSPASASPPSSAPTSTPTNSAAANPTPRPSAPPSPPWAWTPPTSWFVGDKPWRDTAAAHAGGVGTAVVVRGGSADDAEIDAALTGPPERRPAHVIDEMHDLLGLWAGAPLPLTPSTT